MNNIEILEELINDYRNCGLDDFPESVLDFGLNKSQIIAIKNLIQENKELREKDIHITKETVEFVNSHYIHKSKVKEIKEKIHNLLDNNGITRAYQLEIDKYFEDLEEGE